MCWCGSSRCWRGERRCRELGAAGVGVGAAGVGVGAAGVGVGATGVGVGAAGVGVGAADVGVGAAGVGVGAMGAAVAVSAGVSVAFSSTLITTATVSPNNPPESLLKRHLPVYSPAVVGAVNVTDICISSPGTTEPSTLVSVPPI